MNWKAEAKEKLRRYDAMRLATINIPEEVQRLEVDAQAIRSAKMDGDVVNGGGSKREEALLNNITVAQNHRPRPFRTFKYRKADPSSSVHLSRDRCSGTALQGIGDGKIQHLPPQR